MRLNIKPLSVNKAWKGRRYKTDNYKVYEEEICYMLKPFAVPDGHLSLSLVFGFSSESSDIDNPVKPFIDCLQKKYKFNDKRIKELFVTLEKVKKGDEFIWWELKEITSKGTG